MTLIDQAKARRLLPPPGARREIRIAAGISQTAMAAELDVHRATLVRWEDGTHEPRGESVIRYASLLDRLRRVTR